MSYQIKDRVYYKGWKLTVEQTLKDTHIRLSGLCFWVSVNDVKPIVRCNNEIQFR